MRSRPSGSSTRTRARQRHRVLSVFAFQRLNIDRSAERATNGEYAQVNQSLFTWALHPHSCERDMLEGERTARCGAHYRLRLSISAFSPSHSARTTELIVGLRKRRFIATILHLRESPYFALHKGIAIGFVKAIGFRNKPKRTIFIFGVVNPDTDRNEV
jgi:hypothetical protein